MREVERVAEVSFKSASPRDHSVVEFRNGSNEREIAEVLSSDTKIAKS